MQRAAPGSGRVPAGPQPASRGPGDRRAPLASRSCGLGWGVGTGKVSRSERTRRRRLLSCSLMVEGSGECLPGVRQGLQPAAEPISEACAVSRPPVRGRTRDPAFSSRWVLWAGVLEMAALLFNAVWSEDCFWRKERELWLVLHSRKLSLSRNPGPCSVTVPSLALCEGVTLRRQAVGSRRGTSLLRAAGPAVLPPRPWGPCPHLSPAPVRTGPVGIRRRGPGGPSTPGGSCRDPWFSAGTVPAVSRSQKALQFAERRAGATVRPCWARASSAGSVPAKVPSRTASEAGSRSLWQLPGHTPHPVCEPSCGLRVHRGGSGCKRP